MPKRFTVTGAVLLSMFALGACTSNGTPQRTRRDANIRSRAGTPDAQAVAPVPAHASDRDPGSRYLPVAQPLGQVPVESPPFAVPPTPAPPQPEQP